MYVIKPLFMCKMKRYKSLFTYDTDYEELIWAAVQAWLIEGEDGSVVIVDTGASSDKIKSARSLEVEEFGTFEGLLAHNGYSPSDIKTVIMTQLHYDHTGSLALLKNAKVYVQSKEIEAAFNPHPLQKNCYSIADFEGVNFVSCDGEAEIIPGIKVFPVPGHSAGTQAVEIETKLGRAVISGLCTINDNFYPKDRKKEVIIPGIHLNAMEAYDSMIRIKKRADIIIPMHEIELAGRRSIP